MTRRRFAQGNFILLVLVMGSLRTGAEAENVASTPTATLELPSEAVAWHRSPMTEAPRVQVAIVLDTSGSMEGFIHQARLKLWELVTELGRGTRDGKRAQLDLALYTYGSSASEAEQRVWRIAPFTDELDRLSDALFSLTTGGGDEYGAQAIEQAARELDWSDRPGDLKLLFIVGNESLNEGEMSPLLAVKEAEARGIVVNPIYCGSQQQGIADGWLAVAVAGGGQFLALPPEERDIPVATPQDAELVWRNQQLDDIAAAEAPPAPAENEPCDSGEDDCSYLLNPPEERAVTPQGAEVVEQHPPLNDVPAAIEAENAPPAQVEAEICNGIDIDCDAHVDEPLDNSVVPTFPYSPIASQDNVPEPNDTEAAIAAEEARVAQTVVEVCDPIDNDCDSEPGVPADNTAAPTSHDSEEDTPGPALSLLEDERLTIEDRIRRLTIEREAYLGQLQQIDVTRKQAADQAMIAVLHLQAARAHLTFQ